MPAIKPCRSQLWQRREWSWCSKTKVVCWKTGTKVGDFCNKINELWQKWLLQQKWSLHTSYSVILHLFAEVFGRFLLAAIFSDEYEPVDIWTCTALTPWSETKEIVWLQWCQEDPASIINHYRYLLIDHKWTEITVSKCWTIRLNVTSWSLKALNISVQFIRRIQLWKFATYGLWLCYVNVS